MAEENTTDKKDTTGLGQFDLDKIAGIGMSGKQAKAIDTTAIDEQIAALEKPASGSVYDKLAARYRSQGEGAVLRTQKNLANLFGPTVNLIQEREAAAQARFTLLKDKLPEFDDSKIFGMQSGNEMPIVAEIERISKTTKEDMRMLSRLNPNDERYDEIKKRIEKNQDAIVAFDEINKKLLEIRNSKDGREDDSQWSRGMDSTTRQMWEDIYASKGENIKIQDGKLVWTDTKGKTKYSFEDISDYGPKKDALGGADTDLGLLHIQTMDGNKQGTRSSGFFNYRLNNVKEIQTALNNLGFTDDNGNKLNVDGDFGDKTEEAYDKYLAKKDELETAYFNENLSEEDKKKYSVTTGLGETKVIDLNEIGDGPTMIDNLGIQKDIEIQDGIQLLINSDVKVTDPRYNQKIDQLIRTLNSAGPKGIKSLIFDGFGAQPGDVLKSTNTDSFIQQVIQNNPEEFGIKDINNLTEEEIANAYEIMRSRDVTHDYKNSEKKFQTLQSQYLQWYRNEIDTKVREGKKSKLVELKGGKGKGKGKGKATGEFSDYTSGFGTGDQVFLPSKPVNYKGKRVDAEEMQIIFENGQPSIQFFPNDSESKQQLTKSEVIKLLKDAYPNAKEEDIKNWVKNQISSSIKTANEDKEKVKTDTETTDDVDVDNQIDKLLLQNQNIGGREVSDYLLSYGNDDFVINSLNREYGDLGFTFRYSGKSTRKDKNIFGATPPDQLFSDFDTLDVYYNTDDGQQVFSVRFDRATEKKDVEASQTLVKIMKALYNDDKKVLKRIFDGEGDFPGLVR